MIQRVLVVCVGNICRSPMAESVLKFKASRTGLDLHVESAGIGALQGKPAHKHTVNILQRYGLDISEHVGKQINSELMNWADLVLVMEDEHRSHLIKRYPSSSGKVFIMGKWINREIEDPYKKDVDAFEKCFKEVHYASDAWISKLKDCV